MAYIAIEAEEIKTAETAFDRSLHVNSDRYRFWPAAAGILMLSFGAAMAPMEQRAQNQQEIAPSMSASAIKTP